MYPRAKRARYAEPDKPRRSSGLICYKEKDVEKKELMVKNWQASQERVDLFKKQFGDLVLSREYAAFTIKTKDSNFKVHKNILSMHSPVFDAMFRNDKSVDSINIKTFSSATVQEFVDFSYTGDLEDSENPMELYELAKNYEVKELQMICEEIIMEDLDKSTALEVFGFGLDHNNEKLKKRAFDEIKKMYPDKNLDESLFNDPEKFAALLDAKGNYEAALADLEAEESDVSMSETSDSEAALTELEASESDISMSESESQPSEMSSELQASETTFESD